MIVLVALLGCPGTADYDGDGFVEPADCNDNNASAYPGATEIPYDHVDNDCDGSDLTDVDEDGWDAEQVGGKDCNDFRKKVNPSAEEIPYDGIDQNCDGWPDEDFDRDGYAARGHGGEDCDDFDARVVPLDEDGDGFTPCDGDCDESDPLRNPAAPPKCGNGVEDDCDGVSDCAPVGYGLLDEAPIRIVGGTNVIDLGWAMALLGDATGDGLGDIAVGGYESDGETSAIWWFAGPIPVITGPLLARAKVTLPGDDIRFVHAGDVDDDGLGDLLVSFQEGTVAWAGLIGGGREGIAEFSDAAALRMQGTTDIRMGSSLTALDGGDRVAIAARYYDSSAGAVEIVRPEQPGAILAFGETGAMLTGERGDYAGSLVRAIDLDADGADDLVVDRPGGGFPSDAGAYLLTAPPETGQHMLADLAIASMDLTDWGRTLGAVETGDLDDDGADDFAFGTPTLDDMVGAVAIFTELITEDTDPGQAQIHRYGLGDDTFGASLAIEDFDGDGATDLLVGAPAFWNAGGGAYKPGAVHLWYGPLFPGSELSLEADYFLDGNWSGVRTRAGHLVGLSDLDGDDLPDMVVSSPRDAYGVVHVFPGGSSAIGGI